MSKPIPIYAQPHILIPVIIGCFIFFFLTMKIITVVPDVKLDQLALGSETKEHRASYRGDQIHCEDISDAPTCIEGWKERGKRPLIIWLGNSQLHAINQFKRGEMNASELLFPKTLNANFDLLTFSQPNANLQEHYLLFEYLKIILPIKTLLLSAVFDDTREHGIRAGLIPALSEIGVVSELSKTEIGQEIFAENKMANMDDGDLIGLKDTPQKFMESRITHWLREHWSLWDVRPEMRGHLLNILYTLRNSVFNIDAQSKRKIIPGRYVKNLAALETTLQECAKLNINVILYIVPLRNDVETPYLPKEYTRFKEDARSLAGKYGAIYANLEGLVPGGLWGKKDATSANGKTELDFMHFQAGGHRLLANAIFDLLKNNRFLVDQHDI